ncbi:RnfABCDGE type electron transport complex subunit D [Pseudoflavonifractor sp. 60]|uniref:RnfABCDGE type electron transport complex subunit D n=1 Tax=Pseudoflavonifractor sp. 60 TaxID=2304576 RepID=UPI00136A4672|nr:RnfABCDGE type electron transport complex subunit D [Pseudoflavonifractor sp. 60]
MSAVFAPKRLSPQLRQPATTQAMMLDMMVALAPALGMAVFFFGPRALALCGASIFSCVFFEALYRRLTHQRGTTGDLSACVTGLLLALSLPASAPYWVVVMGSAFAIIVVKQFYGGLGRNFMNPALTGRMLAGTMPILMTNWTLPLHRMSVNAVDTLSAATPMSYLHEGALPPQGLDLLLLGQRGGCMGEVSAFMLLLGLIYLLLRRVISLRIPGAYLATVALFALFSAPAGVSPLVWTGYQLMGGGLLMGAIYFATDPATSPVTPRGQIMFGVGCGLLTVLLRSSSSYPEGVGWAILTMNCMVWLLDRLGLPRRFGMGNFAVTRAFLVQLRTSLSEIKFVRPQLNLRHPKPKEGQAPGEAWLDLLRPALRTLGPLAGVAAATCLAIFAVHRLTDLDTARAGFQVQREILAQAMPAATVGAETPYYAPGALSITAGYDDEGQLLGYCVQVQSQGFGGPITMSVGVDLNGAVTGVAIVSHNETDRVGTSAMTPAALARYVGRSGTIRAGGDNSIDAVAGATATSKAITAGVNRALNIVANLDTEEEINYEDS